MVPDGDAAACPPNVEFRRPCSERAATAAKATVAGERTRKRARKNGRMNQTGKKNEAKTDRRSGAADGARQRGNAGACGKNERCHGRAGAGSEKSRKIQTARPHRLLAALSFRRFVQNRSDGSRIGGKTKRNRLRFALHPFPARNEAADQRQTSARVRRRSEGLAILFFLARVPRQRGNAQANEAHTMRSKIKKAPLTQRAFFASFYNRRFSPDYRCTARLRV